MNFVKCCELSKEYIKANFDNSYYKENPDGSIDLELTLYFKPQSYFYLGIIISGTTLILCLSYLGYTFYRKRRQHKSHPKINIHPVGDPKILSYSNLIHSLVLFEYILA